MRDLNEQIEVPSDKKRPIIKKPWQRNRLIVDLEGQEFKVDTSFGNDTDVNNIVKRFQRTGVMPEAENADKGQFADVTNLQEDLTGLLERVETAKAEVAAAETALQQKEAEKAANDAQRLKEYDELRQKQQAENAPPDTE